MGLSIGVKQGSVILVNNEPLTVKAIHATKIEVGFKGSTYAITDVESKEIMPSVFLSLGKISEKTQTSAHEWDLLPRLLFEAPRHIPIRRVRSSYEH